MSEPIKYLDWSEPSPPSEYCRYDHIFIDTPLGRFQVEWKSWKDYPGYGLYLNDNYVSSPDNLDDAKAETVRLIKAKMVEIVTWLSSKGEL